MKRGLSRALFFLFAAGSSACATDTSGFAVVSNSSSSPIEWHYEYIVDWKARFHQEIFNPLTHSMRASEGTIYYLRPGKFFWHTVAPSESKLVALQDKFWIYQPEEKQVFAGTLDFQQPQMKLLLTLLGGGGRLADQFKIEALPGSRLRKKLVPKVKIPQLIVAEIEFDREKQYLKELLLVDSMGQRTTIHFKEVVLNQGLWEQHQKKPIDPFLDRNFNPILP
ncbi:MAG: outer membrane lipoprotein carrier protein LolA [Deltaproteobacteria bacterium]|nr:outer membrane lipoprotein carrier protein LolA [Deltaproteobacteria bacterium]